MDSELKDMKERAEKAEKKIEELQCQREKLVDEIVYARNRMTKAESSLAEAQKRIAELEERCAKSELEGGWNLDPDYYVEKRELVKVKTELAEARKRIEKLSKFQPVVPLKYCREHTTICMPFQGQLACCLEASLAELRKAVKWHRDNDSYLMMDGTITAAKRDDNLYRFLNETE